MIEDIIEVVKMEMKKNNIKIAYLCRATGLSRQTIYNIMNGRRSGINIGTLCKICDAVGLSVTIQKK